MRNRRISNIRLDKSNVDAPTINRALDNIINTVNPFMEETVTAIEEAASPVKDIVGGTNIGVTSTDGVYTINYTGGSGGSSIVAAGTGISVVEAPVGTFTVTNTLPENTDIIAGSGISVNESPVGTFTITNTAQGGGGGGGGLLYYLNDNIAADAPTPVANTKEFGITIQPTQTTYTQLIPKNQPMQFVRGYLSDLNNPNITAIPAGIWEINVFAINDALQPDEVELEARVYVWNGTSLTQIGVSAPNAMTDGATPIQYTLSAVVAQTTISVTDRVYVAIYAQDIKGNDHDLTLYYGGIYPSHAHTTIPYDFVQSITAGTGISITEPTNNNYVITNDGALLTGVSQTFTLVNTFTQTTAFTGDAQFFGNMSLDAGSTFNASAAIIQAGALIGGVGDFTANGQLPLKSNNQATLVGGSLGTYPLYVRNTAGHGLALGGAGGRSVIEGINAAGAFGSPTWINFQGGGDVVLPNANTQLAVGLQVLPDTTSKIISQASLNTNNAFYAPVGSIKLDNGDVTVVGTTNTTALLTTDINSSPYTANIFSYANGPSVNVAIPGSAAPATLVFNTVNQNGINLNLGSGTFTVPATGLYRVQFNGIFRTVTIPVNMWWVAFDLYNVTDAAVQATTSCFQPRAAGGNQVTWAVSDSYEFSLDLTLTLTAGKTYAMRAYNNTASSFNAGFEPTLTNAATSRAGRRYRLQIERKT